MRASRLVMIGAGTVLFIGTACSAPSDEDVTKGGVLFYPESGGAPSGYGGATAGGGADPGSSGGQQANGGPPQGSGAVGQGNGGSGQGNTGAGSGGSGQGNTGASTGGVAQSTGGAEGSGQGETGRLVGMTAAHNAARARVDTQPPLPAVTWSTQIAAVAQAYADQLASQGCQMVHSGNKSYGENLAWFQGGGGGTAERCVELWEGEKACYGYGQFLQSDQCTCSCPSAPNCCGHYTQIAWRNTTEIGCGVASCGDTSIWVCNYGPPGNYIGQNPY